MKSKKLLAFQMELSGLTRHRIAKKTGYSLSSLNTYFAKKGKWHDEYQEWAIEQLADVEILVRDKLISASSQAANALINALNNKNPYIVLAASKQILDRAGFNPVEKISVSDPDDEAEKMTKFFESKT